MACRWRVGLGAVPVAVLAASLTITGCSGGDTPSDGAAPRPLGGPGATTTAAVPRTSDTNPPVTRPPDAGDPDTGPPEGPVTTAPAAAADPAAAAVQEVLDRYARALTDVAARPGALDEPTSPEAVAWAAVLVPGAAVGDEVAGRVRARAAEGVVIVPPDAGGLSWRFRARQVVPRDRPGPREWSFTWCGWSPGIGRAVATGEVVDDAVGHGRGVGTVTEVDGVPRLAALDQTDLTELPAGSPDPCGG